MLRGALPARPFRLDHRIVGPGVSRSSPRSPPGRRSRRRRCGAGCSWCCSRWARTWASSGSRSPTSMARARLSCAVLRRVRHLFVNRTNLRAALVRLVNATFAARDQAWWSEGTACASDSKKFGSWSSNFMTSRRSRCETVFDQPWLVRSLALTRAPAQRYLAAFIVIARRAIGKKPSVRHWFEESCSLAARARAVLGGKGMGDVFSETRERPGRRRRRRRPDRTTRAGPVPLLRPGHVRGCSRRRVGRRR